MDLSRKKRKKESDYEIFPTGYSGFPLSIFLVGKLFFMFAVVLCIPFLFIAPDESWMPFLKVLVLYIVFEFLYRLFKNMGY